MPSSMEWLHIDPVVNQAHTCKTLGVVTTPKSIASTRNTIHAYARVAQCSVLYFVCTNFILATTPSTFRRWVWSRELACMSREAPRFLALELSFSTTAVYSFVFAVWGCDQTCLSIRKISAGALYCHKDGLGSP